MPFIYNPITNQLDIAGTSGGGGGTVTSLSVVTANGFAGTVANPTTTPAITISTTVTGLLTGNGTAISALSASGTGKILRANGTSWVATTATYPDLAGTTGNVLTSDGTNWVSAAASGGGITTINGDDSSITGSTVTIEAGQSTLNCGSSVAFVNSGTTSTLNITDASANVIMGQFAGNDSLSAEQCVGLGQYAFQSLTSSLYSTAIGWGAGNAVLSGGYNTFLGSHCATGTVSTGQANTSVGAYGFTGAGFNGSFNSAVGAFSGNGFTGTESNNILLGHAGIPGDNNTIRIGTQGSGANQQDTCFMAGIFGATTSDVGSTTAVLIDNTGNLGTAASSIRYKENIKDLGYQSSGIYKLRPVSFNYKKDEKKTPQTGLIAEEVLSVLPELVVMKDGIPETVKYHDLPVLLLNEIQKLKSEISALRILVTQGKA
jgi:hypothetical protein